MVKKKNYQQRCVYPKKVYFCRVFLRHQMAVVAQLVRVPDCGSVGRRFESDLPPETMKDSDLRCKSLFFCFKYIPIHNLTTPLPLRRTYFAQTCLSPTEERQKSDRRATEEAISYGNKLYEKKRMLRQKRASSVRQSAQNRQNQKGHHPLHPHQTNHNKLLINKITMSKKYSATCCGYSKKVYFCNLKF